MSHHPLVFSPPGTPLPDRSVGELVAERPNLSRVFQKYGLDFCCQGGLTVREACARKHVALENVVADLEQASAEPVEAGENPATLAIPELVRHIVEKHHDYLRQELPRIHAMADRVAHVHGRHTPELIEVLHTFEGLAEELTSHIEKEEIALFPAVLRMHRVGQTAVDFDPPIQCMLREHDEAGAALARLRELTHNYVPPPDACNTYRALFAGLADLEDDLHRHIHLENSVLFPAARALQHTA